MLNECYNTEFWAMQEFYHNTDSLLLLWCLICTHIIRVVIDKPHPKYHDGDTVKSRQILSFAGCKIIRLWPTKQHPEADHVGHKQDGVESEVADDVSKTLVNDGHQGTQDSKAFGELKESQPDQKEYKTGHSVRIIDQYKKDKKPV